MLVLLVALSGSGCFSHPTHIVEEGQSDGLSLDEPGRHTRAVPLNGQLNLLSKMQEENVEEDAVRRLNELLARLISRKGRLASCTFFLDSLFKVLNILISHTVFFLCFF